MIINIKKETGANLLECDEIPHMHIYNTLTQIIPGGHHCNLIDELRNPSYSDDHIGILALFEKIEKTISGLHIVLF